MRINLDWIKQDTITAGLHMTYGIVLVGMILFISPEIKSAAQTLVARFGSTTALEVFGFKVAFDEGAISRGFALVNLEPEGKNASAVRGKIQALDPKQFIRLMTVGPTSRSCEYEFPKPEMRSSIALDHELEEMKLVTITWSEDVLRSVREEASAASEKAKREGKGWKIGMPVKCYEMKLTTAANDVRTAVVTSIAPGFYGQNSGVSPEGGPKEAPKVTAMN